MNCQFPKKTLRIAKSARAQTALLFILTLVLYGCASAPAATAPTMAPEAPAPATTEVVEPTATQLPTPTTSAPIFTQAVIAPTFQATQIAMSAAPSIPETRRLTLEFPSKMRAGVEGDVVRLTLEVDNLGNITPTAEIAGNKVVGKTIEIPDLYRYPKRSSFCFYA